MATEADPIIRTIAAATRGTPYEGRIYGVGGFLRDRVLGRPWNGDIDFVVEGDAPSLAAFLYERRLSRSAPVVYPRFGTAMLQIDGVNVELVTARRESYDERSRKPAVTASTVQEDALRRDFTINTLLQQIHTGVVLDPTGRAREDIDSGVIRTPLDPDQTFFDDPLRMLRAVRFSAQLGFRLDTEAAESIRRCGDRLRIISGERIRDEFGKILLSDRPVEGLRLLQTLNLLSRFLPEMAGLDGKCVSGCDLWEHTMAVVGALAGAGALHLMLAACLHHACEPARAANPLRRLRFSNDESHTTVLLLELRRSLEHFHRESWTDGDVRRFVRKGGDWRAAAFALAFADREAGDPGLAGLDLEALTARITSLESIVASAALDSPLDGIAIMEVLGVPPGRRVREAKDFLLNEVLEGRLHPTDSAGAVRMLKQKNAGG